MSQPLHKLEMSTAYAKEDGSTPDEISGARERRPSYFDQVFDVEAIGGLTAVMQPRFGLRMIEWFCAMIAFACMGGATDVNDTQVELKDFLADDQVQPSEYYDTCTGTFIFSAYRFLIATGVFIWIYSFMTMLMSVHRKDEGTRCLLCLPSGLLDTYKRNKGFIEFVFDLFLLFFGFCAIMGASVDVELEGEFVCDCEDGGPGDTGADDCTVTTFYTLSTFFETAEARGYQMKANPVSRIRAGIAFMFFCWFALTYSIYQSWKEWQEEKKAAEDSSAGAGAGAGASADAGAAAAGGAAASSELTVAASAGASL